MNGADSSTVGRPSPEQPDRPSGRRALQWLIGPSGLTFLSVLVFTAIGGYVRLAQLGQGSEWVDEAQSTLLAFNVVQYGYPIIRAPHLITNWEPLYPYLEAVSIKLLGYSNFAYRLPSALLGTALIPISYLVGRRLRDRYVGIALAGMVAFSTEYIAWSRQARWYILLVLLMALGFLVVTVWHRSRSARERKWCLVALVILAALAATASIGEFLLYVPGILVGALVYLIASRWDGVRGFFGLPPRDQPGTVLPPARLLPYRLRLPILLGVVAAVTIVTVLDQALAFAVYKAALRPVFGYTPYPPVWSANIPQYLLSFYPGILAAAFLGGVYVSFRRDSLELALVAFCAISFLTVTVGASFANNIAYSGLSFPRHLFPLLYFLFLLASVGIVESFQRLYALARSSPRVAVTPRARRVAPAAFAVVLVTMLVLPGAIVPSGQSLGHQTVALGAGALMPWVAFSVDPANPSALYGINQADYQFAASYVEAHRNPGDAIAGVDPGPPAVYLGHVEYWIRGNPTVPTILYVNGQPGFYQTGSLLIDNTAALEQMINNSTGWFVSDQPSFVGAVFPGGMALVVQYFMTAIPAGTDSSIWLYHWTRSSPIALILTLPSQVSYLAADANNSTRIADWATIAGVTSSHFRPALLPMEAALLPYVSSGIYPLSLLVNLYNQRPDLQVEFPQMLQNSSNDTALIGWAYQVATGHLTDPAQPILAPYANWYKHHE